MIEQIREAITSRLTTLTGEGQPLSQVAEYMTLNIVGYPCAIVHHTQFVSEVFDSCHYQRTRTTPIYIMQEIQNVSREQAYSIVENIMDQTATIFEKDDDLGGLVQSLRITLADIGEYTNGSDGHYIGGIMTLNVTTLHNKY